MSSKKRKTLDTDGKEKDQWDDKAIAVWVKDNKRLERDLERLKDKISMVKARAVTRHVTTEKVRRRYLQANTVEVDECEPCPSCKKLYQHIKGENCYWCGGVGYHWGLQDAHLMDGKEWIVRGMSSDCLACKLTPDVSDEED